MLPVAFMALLATLAGHEILHCKETVHKIVGCIPLTIMFYTHFYDEHVRGHHKNLGTLADPIWPPVGRTVYGTVYNAAVYTHVSTWNREVERIKRNDPKASSLQILMQNAMVHYLILHIGMACTIYQLFGMGGLKLQLVYAASKITFNEAGNYFTHYGLERYKD